MADEQKPKKHSLTVKNIGVLGHPDGPMLDVEVEINDGENTVLRKFGYPLGTTKEEVEADLKNVVAGFDGEAEHQLRVAANDAAMAEVEKMKDELKGKSFGKSPEKKDE